MAITIRAVSKRFGDAVALDDVNLEVESGSLTALLGPSGGGKSTLLRIIAGLEHPDSGTVEIDGQRVDFEEATLRGHRRTIGTFFQPFTLFPHLTALQTIPVPLEKFPGPPPPAAEEIARQLLVRFRL